MIIFATRRISQIVLVDFHQLHSEPIKIIRKKNKNALQFLEILFLKIIKLKLIYLGRFQLLHKGVMKID